MKTVQSKEIGGQNQPDSQLCSQSTKPWFGARGTSSRRQWEYLYSCCFQSSGHHQLSSLKKNSMFLNYNNTNAEGSRMSMASGDCTGPEGQANHGMNTNRCRINTLKQSCFWYKKKQQSLTKQTVKIVTSMQQIRRSFRLMHWYGYQQTYIMKKNSKGHYVRWPFLIDK